MKTDLGQILATVVVFGLGNIGALVFMLGGLRSTVRSQSERLDRHDERFDKVEAEVALVRVDVGELKGRAEARS